MMQKRFELRLPEPLAAQLDALAAQRGITRNALIAVVMGAYVEEQTREAVREARRLARQLREEAR